jgi:hypothetical protein
MFPSHLQRNECDCEKIRDLFQSLRTASSIECVKTNARALTGGTLTGAHTAKKARSSEDKKRERQRRKHNTREEEKREQTIDMM